MTEMYHKNWGSRENGMTSAYKAAAFAATPAGKAAKLAAEVAKNQRRMGFASGAYLLG